MSRMQNNNVAGMRRMANQPQQPNGPLSGESYNLIPAAKVAEKKRKRNVDEEGEEIDLFDQKVKTFSNKPNMSYVNQQTNQIDMARIQQRQMKNTITQNYTDRMERGKHIKEIHSVPSHMNIAPIQYYPRPHLKNTPASSSTSTQKPRQSCGGNYRTHIPHEEIVEMCTKRPPIRTKEEFDEFLKAVQIEPMHDKEDNDNDKGKEKMEIDNSTSSTNISKTSE